MTEFRISNKGTTQLFNNKILERLTRTSFIVPVFMFYTIALGCIIYAAWKTDVNMLELLYLFPLGLFVFSLVEYLIHRFLFHFTPANEKQARIKYSVHMVHHEYPRDKDRLAMPPLLSITVALIFFFLFWPVLGERVWLFFPGFTSGYSTYLIIHYAIHRFRPPSNFLRYLWKHHSLHHYKSDDYAFSVSLPIWDIIFGTMPTAKEKSDILAANKLPDTL